MGQRTIANGMVTKRLKGTDAMIMEIILKNLIRQQIKHAVHVAEGKRGQVVRIVMTNSGIRQQRRNNANLSEQKTRHFVVAGQE